MPISLFFFNEKYFFLFLASLCCAYIHSFSFLFTYCFPFLEAVKLKNDENSFSYALYKLPEKTDGGFEGDEKKCCQVTVMRVGWNWEDIFKKVFTSVSPWPEVNFWFLPFNFVKKFKIKNLMKCQKNDFRGFILLSLCEKIYMQTRSETHDSIKPKTIAFNIRSMSCNLIKVSEFIYIVSALCAKILSSI